MTDKAASRLPGRLALAGVAAATGLWLVALLVHAVLPAGGAAAPALEWGGVGVGYLASLAVFAGLGWLLGLASR
jgi:hypothetical protein